MIGSDIECAAHAHALQLSLHSSTKNRAYSLSVHCRLECFNVHVAK